MVAVPAGRDRYGIEQDADPTERDCGGSSSNPTFQEIVDARLAASNRLAPLAVRHVAVDVLELFVVAHAGERGARELVAERHPDQHAERGGRCGRDADGPAGVDRYVPRFADRRRHADQQLGPWHRRDQSADGAAEQPGGHAQPARRAGRAAKACRQSARAHHPLEIRKRLQRADVLLGHLALAGDPEAAGHGSTINGDKFGSPDGIYVAPSGRLWIQTDVSASTINTGNYAGFGKNQMVCADPVTGELRRFLVGPNACEVTGVFTTPDERTMFVGIQHPGGPRSGNHTPTGADPKAISSWPDGDEGGRPRSACPVITKDDGGPIGS
jgi:hypothetical protein